LTINAHACLDAYATPTLHTWLLAHTTGNIAVVAEKEAHGRRLLDKEYLTINTYPHINTYFI